MGYFGLFCCKNSSKQGCSGEKEGGSGKPNSYRGKLSKKEFLNSEQKEFRPNSNQRRPHSSDRTSLTVVAAPQKECSSYFFEKSYPIS